MSGEPTMHRKTNNAAPDDRQYTFKIVESPIGSLKLVASQHGLAAILWKNDNPRRVRIEGAVQDDRDPVLRKAETQLAEYFIGKRQTFDLDLDFNGTPFQKEVWSALIEIPFGETRTYGEIARELGRPKASLLDLEQGRGTKRSTSKATRQPSLFTHEGHAHAT
jgi:methylated-DNA-[protein]-cysteine S-methyltransferase